MVAVLGLQLAAPLVSNLGQTTGTPISTDYDERSAQAFVAAPGPFDFGYRFQGIRVSARGLDVFEELHIPQVRASLHGDSGGIPGARLHTLTMPLDFASTETFTDYTLLAPPGTVLRGGARYWVVFEVLDNTLYLEGTNSADEDPRLDAWSIDNYSYTNTKQSSGWVSVTRVTDAIPRIIKVAVLGSPQWVTNEADGPDLPGAGHNAHQTIGVVTPGIVSTGHLTPSLDYDHGHSGDYWWLETQRGHSYRIEVKFGDNQNNDTGGSAWMSFIDPDHDDYPYASGCCEADHNRDDGHTFVHFYRPTDDWNNRYLINVAAFDKLNTGSSTYNGPYTITMTDITGTREFVSNLYQDSDSRTNLPAVGAARQYAIFFETGHHAAGYQLDRIQTFITAPGKPGVLAVLQHNRCAGHQTVRFPQPTAGSTPCDVVSRPTGHYIPGPRLRGDNPHAHSQRWTSSHLLLDSHGRNQLQAKRNGFVCRVGLWARLAHWRPHGDQDHRFLARRPQQQNNSNLSLAIGTLKRGPYRPTKAARHSGRGHCP